MGLAQAFFGALGFGGRGAVPTSGNGGGARTAAGDLNGTSSTNADPRVGQLTGESGIVTLRDGAALHQPAKAGVLLVFPAADGVSSQVFSSTRTTTGTVAKVTLPSTASGRVVASIQAWKTDGSAAYCVDLSGLYRSAAGVLTAVNVPSPANESATTGPRGTMTTSGLDVLVTWTASDAASWDIIVDFYCAGQR